MAVLFNWAGLYDGAWGFSIITPSNKSKVAVSKNSNPIDKHVGMRLRTRRLSIDMSQEKLGEALGVTFQQVQKYEKGTNRIGASRLQLAARVLEVPVNYFFDGVADADGLSGAFAEPHAPSYRSEAGQAEEAKRLAEAFLTIGDSNLRHRILALVEAMAQQLKA